MDGGPNIPSKTLKDRLAHGPIEKYIIYGLTKTEAY